MSTQFSDGQQTREYTKLIPIPGTKYFFDVNAMEAVDITNGNRQSVNFSPDEKYRMRYADLELIHGIFERFESELQNAFKLLESLNNCTNCVDCSYCTNCHRCFGCVRCDSCTDCDRCQSCHRCDGCVLCTYSGSLAQCHKVNLSTECQYCEACVGCNNCSHAEDLSSCNAVRGISRAINMCDVSLDPKRISGLNAKALIERITKVNEVSNATYMTSTMTTTICFADYYSRGLYDELKHYMGNIVSHVLEEVSKEGNYLEMDEWHTCDTSHCFAGWIAYLCQVQFLEQLGKAEAELEAARIKEDRFGEYEQELRVKAYELAAEFAGSNTENFVLTLCCLADLEINPALFFVMDNEQALDNIEMIVKGQKPKVFPRELNNDVYTPEELTTL